MENKDYIINSDGELILYYGTSWYHVVIPDGVKKIGKNSLPNIEYMDEDSSIVIPESTTEFDGLELGYTPSFTICTVPGSPAESYAKRKGISVCYI